MQHRAARRAAARNARHRAQAVRARDAGRGAALSALLVGALAMLSVKGLSIFAAAQRCAMPLGYAVVVARSRVTSQRIQGHEGSPDDPAAADLFSRALSRRPACRL